MADDYDKHDSDWLRDQLRQRDRKIAELRSEQDESSDLIRRLRENAEDYTASIESWCEAFGMVLTDKGWTWSPFWDEYAKLTEDYSALVRQWNRALPILNAGLQDVGRPLAASDAQVAVVLKLRKAGHSLRAIVDETNLTLRTVRTIVERKRGVDRTTKARRQRIEIDKQQRAHWKARKRTGDALPKRVETVIETGKALVIEAKGLGRAR
jgi:transposase